MNVKTDVPVMTTQPEVNTRIEQTHQPEFEVRSAEDHQIDSERSHNNNNNDDLETASQA